MIWNNNPAKNTACIVNHLCHDITCWAVKLWIAGAPELSVREFAHESSAAAELHPSNCSLLFSLVPRPIRRCKVFSRSSCKLDCDDAGCCIRMNSHPRRDAMNVLGSSGLQRNFGFALHCTHARTLLESNKELASTSLLFLLQRYETYFDLCSRKQ